jgi:urease accessory protein
MTTESLLGLLQFSDGTFPAGGYAHSLGLETYVQEGRVGSAAGVQAFLEALLAGSAGPCDAVAVVIAHAAARDGDLASAFDLDERLEAMKAAEEQRSASRQMGRQTLRAARALVDEDVLSAWWTAVEARRTPGHHAVVLGFVGRIVGASPETCAAAYLYSTAALVTGAALRLMPLGQVEAQKILWALRPRIARLAAEAVSAAAGGGDALWSFGPGLDLAAMRHAGLDGRLFRS